MTKDHFDTQSWDQDTSRNPREINKHPHTAMTKRQLVLFATARNSCVAQIWISETREDYHAYVTTRLRTQLSPFHANANLAPSLMLAQICLLQYDFLQSQWAMFNVRVLEILKSLTANKWSPHRGSHLTHRSRDWKYRRIKSVDDSSCDTYNGVEHRSVNVGEAEVWIWWLTMTHGQRAIAHQDTVHRRQHTASCIAHQDTVHRRQHTAHYTRRELDISDRRGCVLHIKGGFLCVSVCVLICLWVTFSSMRQWERICRKRVILQSE